ncbi:MAG: hypothetical protein R3251_00085 [Candidatus Spechtbacterales bacterium]|nr:hypothetical protein [Candidatus Spechtbacterales bacterium]
MEEFTWKVSKEDRPMPWVLYSIVGIVSIAIAAFFVYSGNIFGAALFIMGPVVIVISATKGQKEVYCTITDSEIKVNNRQYPFKNLEYYSIIADTLILKPKEQGVVYVPIFIEDTEHIHEYLFGKVKQNEDYQEDFSQIVNRFLRIH